MTTLKSDAATGPRRPTPARGDILPALRLATAPAGTPATLRAGRGPRVLLVPHSAGCEPCREWMRALAADGRAVDDWGARLSIAVAEPLEQAVALQSSLPSGIQTFADPEQALGVMPGTVLIADEWGEVYFAMSAGAQHDLPSPSDIVEWARFIAVQCPECESPEGEWRTL